MTKKPSQSNQLFANLDTPFIPLWAKIAICLAIGAILAVIIPIMTSRQYITTQTERIGSIAYLISSERVTALRDNTEQSADDYTILKSRLEKVKTVNSDARFLYLMARDSDKSVRFLVDSEAPGTDGYSPRNQKYTEASDALIAMFDNGKPLVEGPVSDRWGSWLSVLAPIRNDAGEVVGVVGLDIPSSRYITMLVISAAVPMLVALLVASIIMMSNHVRKRRQETLRMRGELVSIASHELRSPLTGIRWGEEMLMSAQLPDKESKIIKTMYDSTVQLQESIDDMLQLASLQTSASVTQASRVTTNMVEMIDSICIIQQLPAQQKGVELEYGPNWPVLVMANVDPLPMRRTFNNLISNAIKYSRAQTKVIVDYEVIDGNHVFTVQDHGIGIPKAEQHKVFDGFYRATNAIKLGVIGTGMGLYLSRNVVEQHGGKLWLSSQEDEGTTIYVQLPK